MKYFKEFIIITNPFIPDIVSGFLWELNISGINEEDDALIIFADAKDELTKEEIHNQLQKLIDNKIINSFEIEEKIIEDKDWNEEWEKGLNIVEVSDKIIIKPSFKDYENKENKIVITIDPKMSFGTGEHETTKLIVQFLEKYIRKGMKILDVGTGTGILSILSIKLGAKSVYAIDNDEWCFENAQENSQLNNVNDKIDIRFSEIPEVLEKDFDLILANIQKNVLLNISSEIVKRLSKNGFVILSGLLIEDEKDIVEQYKELKLVDCKTMGEWLALVFKKM